MKVTAVEIKDVEIPEQMQRAMARQAEAERERRAKIINSEGEFQAAQKLTDAADIISTNPASLQLRYLQTLLEIGSNQNTTVVFPLPMDVLEPFIGTGATTEPAAARRSRRPPQPPTPPSRRRRRTSPTSATSPPPGPEPAARDPHRPAQRAADDPRPRPGRPPGPVRLGDAERASRRPTSCPFCEGREDSTPPEIYALRPGRRRARHARAGGPAWCRTSTRRWAARRRTRPPRRGGAGGAGGRSRRLRQRRRPAARLAAGRRTRPLLLAPGERRPRGDRQRAPARDRDGRARRRAVRRRGRDLARADARPRRRLLRAADRQRGRRRRRLARAHPRPALRAALRAGGGRPRARAGRRLRANAPPAAACSATSWSRRCAARERLVAIDDEAALICPWASRSPFELRVVPRREAASFAEDDDRRGDDPHRDARSSPPASTARRSSTSGSAPPPRGDRALPLARRHRPAADDQGRLRARHRRRHQHLPARAGGGRPARSPGAE